MIHYYEAASRLRAVATLVLLDRSLAASCLPAVACDTPPTAQLTFSAWLLWHQMEEELSLGAEEQEVWLVQLESEKIGCTLLGCMLGSASSSAGAPAAGCFPMVWTLNNSDRLGDRKLLGCVYKSVQWYVIPWGSKCTEA